MLLTILFALAGTTAAVVDHVRSDDREDTGKRPVLEASGRSGQPKERTSFLSKLIPPPPERVRGPRVPRSIRDLANRLPLQRKVAQLFLFGFEGQDLTDPIFEQLRRLDIGGIVLGSANYLNPQQLSTLANEAGLIAQGQKHIPPWVMAAQEGGEFNEFPDLPPAKAPAQLANSAEARRVARKTATSLQPLGINGVLAPVIDIGTADGSGAFDERAFSDDVERVAKFAKVTVQSYGRAKLMAAPKHFPGLGAASQSPDQGPANVGLATSQLLERDVIPFRAAIAAGARAILVGHGLYATDDFTLPASLSRAITTGILRDELEFKGVAIADDLSSPAITATTSVPDAAIAAIKAGADLLFISGPAGEQQAAYVALLNAVRKREVPRARINEALVRSLIAKEKLGLIREQEDPQAPQQ